MNTHRCFRCDCVLSDRDLYQGRLLLGNAIHALKPITDPIYTIFCCTGYGCEQKAMRYMDKQYKIAWGWGNLKHLPSGFPWKKSFVYFITDGEAVKIGTASNVGKRLQALQIGNPRQLICIKQVPGDAEVEKLIHEAYADYRIRGEWYRYESEMKRLIDGPDRLIQEFNRRRSLLDD